MHSRDSKNYYVLLGLDPYQRFTYLDADIKKAFRGLISNHHPDRNRQDSDAATEKFKEITEAYTFLMDRQIRRGYDEDLSIEDRQAFAEKCEQRRIERAHWRDALSFEKQKQYEKSQEKKRRNNQAHKREESGERYARENKKSHVEFGSLLEYCRRQSAVSNQRRVDSTHFLIKLLVSIYISIKLLPRMLIEAFFGLFVIPEFIIFATEQAASYIIPGIDPNKSFHPAVRASVVLLTLCLLPLVMLVGAFVLPYVYFNINERKNAAKTYQQSVLFFQPYFNNKIVETIFVGSCFAGAAALFVIYPPAGLLHIFGTGGTIATYLGLEAASKAILVSAISGITAVIAATSNLLIDKIQSYFPKQYPKVIDPYPLNLNPKIADEKASQVMHAPSTNLNLEQVSPTQPSSVITKTTKFENLQLITPITSEWAVLRANARLTNIENREVQLSSQHYLRFLSAARLQEDEKHIHTKNEKALALVLFRSSH